MEIFHGRPADCSGREPREVRTYDLLDRLGIEYLRTDHAPATTMEVCKDIDGVLEVLICKNLFLCNRQQTQFYLLMMPGDKPFKTKDLSAQLGVARLSFAGEDFMEQISSVCIWGQRQRVGPDDRRPGAGAPGHRRGGSAGRIPGLPPLPKHQQHQAAHRGPAAQVSPAVRHEPTVVRL